jgi:hypothetical protein
MLCICMWALRQNVVTSSASQMTLTFTCLQVLFGNTYTSLSWYTDVLSFSKGKASQVMGRISTLRGLLFDKRTERASYINSNIKDFSEKSMLCFQLAQYMPTAFDNCLTLSSLEDRLLLIFFLHSRSPVTPYFSDIF